MHRSVTFGLPPAASPLDEEGITFPARWWYGRGTDIIPVDLSFASSDEGKLWIQDEAVDPAGIAMPQAHLPGFWVTAKDTTQAKPDQYEKVQIVLYIVGGGYITGKISLSCVQDPAETCSYRQDIHLKLAASLT